MRLQCLAAVVGLSAMTGRRRIAIAPRARPPCAEPADWAAAGAIDARRHQQIEVRLMSESGHPVSRHTRLLLAAVAALAVGACSGTSTASPVVSASAAPVATEAPSIASMEPSASSPASEAPSASAAAASDSAEPTAVPTAIDPCQLIPAAEASSLTGASFGDGKETELSGNAKMCVYGSETKNVFEVIVAVAPDVATAQAEEADAEAQLKSQAAQVNQGLTITKMPGFTTDSDAVLMELKPNSIGIDGRGIYVLRGTVFFGFNDLAVGGKAPTADAMKTEATAVLSRLP
jgi:hypothetical protein